MKHVIFDYDGVLVDSFDFHLKKVNEIYHIGLTPQEFKDTHDGNFYQSTLQKFQSMDFSEYARLVGDEQSKLPLQDGARETLIYLMQNHTIHLVTSAWEAQVVPFLKRHEIFDLFTTHQYADNSKSKCQKLEWLINQTESSVSDFVFVTDTLGDLLEARQLQLQTIAVTFGFHSRDHLQDGNPTYFADSFKEIERIINLY